MSDLDERDERESHFADSQWVLYAIFRIRKDRSLEEVSEKINVPYSTMRKYVIGKMACPVEVIKRTYAVTRHQLLKELLEPEGFELIPKGKCSLHLLPSVDAHTVDAMGKLVDLQRKFEKYFEDQRLDSQEYRDLKILKGEVADAINHLWGKIASMAEAEKVRAVS